MIVEFIGCSGAGKTSRAEGLRRRSHAPRAAVLSIDLVRDRPGLRWMSDPSLINLAADEGTTSPITLIYNWKPKA